LDDNTHETDDHVSRFWSKIGLMAEISRIFRNQPPEKETYEKVLKIVHNIIPFESATFLLYDENQDILVEESTCGDKPEPLDIDYLLADRNFTRWLKDQKQPILSTELNALGKPLPSEKSTFLIIPLLVDNTMIGVVYFIGGTIDTFRDKDVKLLSIIGEQIAMSIERSIHQKKLEQNNSDLKKAQQQLQNAQDKIIDDERLAAVKELAASINHKINNPLSVITGNTEYLLFKYPDLDQKILERLKVIGNEAVRISEINRQLLDIHRLVTEPYLKDGDGVRMIDFQKSTSGISNG
jgi:signal transduction histidine kinase